ncbi:uncharacterized protein [Parasteatoda tepidariorum]|uniref:uncharacterized protein n=1 Tax=Parasteatoda tepidariorum TaxID=114398 RepID=UPI0039BCD2BB
MNINSKDFTPFLIVVVVLCSTITAYAPRYQKQTTPKPDDGDLYTSENNRPTSIKYLPNSYDAEVELLSSRMPTHRHNAFIHPPNTLTKLTRSMLANGGGDSMYGRRKRYHPLRSFMLAKWSSAKSERCATKTGNFSDSKNCTEGEIVSEQTPHLEKRISVPSMSDSPKLSNFRRPYDVPQIECPPAKDGTEQFSCPSPDRANRYRCIDDRSLCDGFIDCPNAEDEDMRACMFYKTTKAHLDVLADALLRWARGRF